MDRRTFLRAGGVATAAGLAGCLGVFETQSLGTPPVLDDRPTAVYYPTHVEGMKMVGTASSGDYEFAAMYSYPHRFWTVTGTSVQRKSIEDAHDVHLMATVWDPETRTVLPETGLSIEVTRDGDLVSEEVIYPMLSQPMGFHYGGNFALDGDGTYDVTVSVAGVRTRKTGAFEGQFGDAASGTITFEYAKAERDEIRFERTPEKAGTRAAVEPMEMAAPNSLAPPPEALPGRVVGEATTGGAVLVATTLDDRAPGGETYLAISARTPYNRTILPAMGLTATLTRGDETLAERSLERTLDPDLGYHYGATVPAVEAGDGIELAVGTPPQVARHEGYETAFVEMPPATVQVE